MATSPIFFFTTIHFLVQTYQAIKKIWLRFVLPWGGVTPISRPLLENGRSTIYTLFNQEGYKIFNGSYNYVSPLWEIYCFTCHRSFVRHISFVSVVFSVYHAGCQTRDVDPMSGYCWPTVHDAEPTLAQYWATVSCLTPR